MSKLGQVTDVTVDEQENKVFVDVSVSPTDFEEGIRFRTPGVGVWFIPKEGDIVEVKRLSKNRAVAFSPYNPPEFDIPTGLSEGDIVFKLDQNTVFRFELQNDETYDITLETDGDITLTGDNVNINETT